LLTRRKFLYTGAAAAAGIAALGTDGFLQCERLQVKKLEIPLARLPEAFDGLSIAHLSDFHYDQRFSVRPIRKAVEIVNQLRPDIVVLTGDFVTAPMFEYGSHNARQSAKRAAPCAQLLQMLQAPMGKFAVLGNHDAVSDSRKIVNDLQAHDIPVLQNRSIPLERGKARIWIAGVDDALDGMPDLAATIDKVPSGEATVLLAHEPDFADESSLRQVDLQLSGHSHGGQIWIPGIGAPWLPSLARKYPRGLYKVGNLTLYTNIGIGTIRAPVRINCPPEITLITLRTVQSKSKNS